MHRYYCRTPIEGDAATLDDAEAHHLLHVLRARPGMEVVLFDGGGAEFAASVVACRRAEVELTILARNEVDRELPFPLTLGVALPKGDRQRWLVEKATELGVTRLVPLATERTVGGDKRGGEKLDRYVVEASKQCGRNRLMEIAEPLAWDAWLGVAEPVARRWFAHPGGRSIGGDEIVTPCVAYAAVGPEGGFTDDEAAAAIAAGWQTIGLGTCILRVETAAVAIAALHAQSAGTR